MRHVREFQKNGRIIRITQGWSFPTFLFGPLAVLPHGDWAYGIPLLGSTILFGFIGLSTGGIGYAGIFLCNLLFSFSSRERYARILQKRGYEETDPRRDDPTQWVYVPVDRTLEAGHQGVTSHLATVTVPAGYRFCDGFAGKGKEPVRDEVTPELRLWITNQNGVIRWETTIRTAGHLSAHTFSFPVKEQEVLTIHAQRQNMTASATLSHLYVHLTR